ncbi:FKBP-type peptidyl-prolyl cis-trans isomerase [Ekhidna sp.]
MKKLFYTSVILSSIWMTSCGNDDEPVSREKQLSIDLAVIDNHLDENNIDTEEHESGIRYVMNVEGTGDGPSIGDKIALKFEGFYLDGGVIGRDTIGFTLDFGSQLIEAWRLMIPEIKEGGSITIYAPSIYCFGSVGNGPIPPNANLIYTIEVISIIDDVEEQQSVDEAIIDEFLSESGIEAETHSSGIRFVTEVEGTGGTPASEDEVVVKYEGTVLSGAVFDSNDVGVQFALTNLIEAWQIMIPTMSEGGKIKIYTPSIYGYGPSGNQTIPPNTILVFEIELLEVK